MNNDISKKVFKFSNDQVCFWVEQDSSIMIKAKDRNYDDPVEIEAEEAKEIAEALLKCAKYLIKLDN